MDEMNLTPDNQQKPSDDRASLDMLLSWADSALEALEQGKAPRRAPEATHGDAAPAEAVPAEDTPAEPAPAEDIPTEAIAPEDDYLEDEIPEDETPEDPADEEPFDYNDDELLRGYVWDEETGRLYRVDERSRSFSFPLALGICLGVLTLIGALCSGAPVLPAGFAQDNSILSAEQSIDSPEAFLPGETQADAEAQAAAEYIPAQILSDGRVVAVMASTEAAHALLEDVKAYFNDAVSGQGEKESVFEDDVEIRPLPEGTQAQTASYDELFALFTSEASPIRVRTTLTTVEIKTLPFETDTKKDSTLIEGTRIVASMGREGSQTTRTRTVYINGDRSTSRSGTETDTVKPRDMVIYQGSEKLDTEEDSPGRHEGEKGPDKGELSFIAPVKGDIVCNFGQLYGVLHLGLDYRPEGDAVCASAPGTVVTVLERDGYGLMLEIDHGNGFLTRYAHLDSAAVAPGDAVTQGQIIAAPGSSGNVEEKTLHFELRVDGIAYNPRYYLD